MRQIIRKWILVILALLLAFSSSCLAEEANGEDWKTVAENAIMEDDYATALPALEQGAAQGDPWAQTELGLCYIYEYDVQFSDEKAFEYFNLAAAQGYADAQNLLGYFYLHGIATAQSYEKAEKYLRLAADQGHAGAQWNLARCYMAVLEE